MPLAEGLRPTPLLFVRRETEGGGRGQRRSRRATDGAQVFRASPCVFAVLFSPDTIGAHPNVSSLCPLYLFTSLAVEGLHLWACTVVKIL